MSKWKNGDRVAYDDDLGTVMHEVPSTRLNSEDYWILWDNGEVSKVWGSDLIDATLKARVTLFKPSGKYYTSEEWRIPKGAIGPYDMLNSPDFRRIGGGTVLVEAQEPWGYPHLFPGVDA